MRLEEIRSKFVTLSGRNDLVKTVSNVTNIDNGADFFINAGQRLLDTLQNTPESFKRYIEDIVQGGYKMTFPDCRAIKEVWLTNADGRFPLEKKSIGWIRQEYGEDYSVLDTGQPLYFAPSVHTLAPAQSLKTADDFTGMHDYGTVEFGLIGYHGVVIVPPADGTYTVNIWGLFFSGTLVDSIKAVGDITFTGQPANEETFTLGDDGVDYQFTFVTGAPANDAQVQIGADVGASIDNAVTVVNAKATMVIAANASDSYVNKLRVTAITGGVGGNTIAFLESIANATISGAGVLGGTVSGVDKMEESWWTVMYPEVSVLGALWALESFYRNTEGMRDQMNAINTILVGIDRDIVSEEIAGVTQIIG